MDIPGGTSGKEPACQSRRCKRCSFSPWVGKILWRRAWPFTPVFLPGESHGRRSLAILVSLLLIGLWWGKRESASSPFWFLVWGLDAYGKHTINLSHLVRGLISIEQLKGIVMCISWGRTRTLPQCSITVSFFLFFFNLFLWRIIALQYWVGFCHVSTQISHRYTHRYTHPYPLKPPSQFVPHLSPPFPH